MMVVCWATKLRGFLRHISEKNRDVQFINSGSYYEVSDAKSKLKSKLIRSKLFDHIGLFQVIDIKGKDCDVYASFNRFLKTDKPYFIYLENPTALYHYSLNRIKYLPGKCRFKKCLGDSNLKYIVCMSDACRGTFESINMPLPRNVRMETIYPFVPENTMATDEKLREKSNNKTMECLYCVQGKRFVTKGGLDVLEAFSRVYRAGNNVHLTIITKISEIETEILQQIKQCAAVDLYDFDFTYEELEQKYAETNVLLHPSSDDSFGLTILEAMKAGCAVISTNLYAIPEMVEDNVNGYLIEPKYRIFSKDNIPNPQYWAYKRKVQGARKENDAFVNAIEERILMLYNDREKLFQFSKNSLEIANEKFGEEKICGQWNAVWDALKGIPENET